MVNISKEKLSKKVSKEINKKLIETIYSLKNKNNINLFFEELLTYAEKVVLAKRLAVIFMLYEKISLYRIHKILKISKTTVIKIANDCDLGKYENILEIVKKRKNRVTFWDGMEVVLKCGMPPIVGKGRWDFLNQIEERYKK